MHVITRVSDVITLRIAPKRVITRYERVITRLEFKLQSRRVRCRCRCRCRWRSSEGRRRRCHRRCHRCSSSLFVVVVRRSLLVAALTCLRMSSVALNAMATPRGGARTTTAEFSLSLSIAVAFSLGFVVCLCFFFCCFFRLEPNFVATSRQ